MDCFKKFEAKAEVKAKEGIANCRLPINLKCGSYGFYRIKS